MSLRAYRAQIAEWEKEYGIKSRAFAYDPTEQKLTCVRCGKMRRKMSRHHICHDFWFACMFPELYARRYLEFRKDETAKLCSGCHRQIHEYTAPIMERMKLEFYNTRVELIFRDDEGNRKWCELWRWQFKEAFEKWLTTKTKRVQHGRKRRRTVSKARQRTRSRN